MAIFILYILHKEKCVSLPVFSKMSTKQTSVCLLFYASKSSIARLLSRFCVFCKEKCSALVFIHSLTYYATIALKGGCYKNMTNVTNWKHSIIDRINYGLNQSQVAKVKEGKTHHAAGVLHFTRLKSSDPVVFRTLPGESADLRRGQPDLAKHSRLSRPRAYMCVGSWSWSWS